MEQIRKGLTLEYAKEKREKLLAELKSDEHYSQTETVAYGHHDPLSVPVAACDSLSWPGANAEGYRSSCALEYGLPGLWEGDPANPETTVASSNGVEPN